MREEKASGTKKMLKDFLMNDGAELDFNIFSNNLAL